MVTSFVSGYVTPRETQHGIQTFKIHRHFRFHPPLLREHLAVDDEKILQEKSREYKQENNNIKAERINREKEGERIGPLLLSLHPPSGSHQRLTQEGAAMPCWGARERLLFPPGAAETTIGQCVALQRSAVQPILA